MGSNIRVSASRMSSDRDSIGDEMTNIHAAIKALENAMNALALCWEGPAWHAFQNEVEDSINDMQDLDVFIRRLLDGVRDSEGMYMTAENENCDRLKRIRV